MWRFLPMHKFQFHSLGVYTFKNKQSSSPQNCEKLNVVCKHFAPNSVAFRTPVHGSMGCGALKRFWFWLFKKENLQAFQNKTDWYLTRNRKGPIGGFAYGMPWNEKNLRWSKSVVAMRPAKSPLFVFTINAASFESSSAVVADGAQLTTPNFLAASKTNKHFHNNNMFCIRKQFNGI